MVIKLNYKIIILVVAAFCVIAAVSVALPSLPAGSATVRSDADSVCVPILMYHEVKPFKPGKDSIYPYEFENDLKYLKDTGYTTITMSDLINYVYGGTQLPEKPIIISFDDGYLNNYIYAMPLLKKYQLKIVFSIIGKDTDDFTEISSKNLDYSHVTWTQINEMLDTGLVEIQNHTYNLHKITRSRFGCGKSYGESQEHYSEVLKSDICRLQNEITLFTGRTPNTFTYPYGKISKDSEPIIKSMGFKASLSCDYGVNIISDDPETLYGLKRICRSHNVSLKKLLSNAMETLKYTK